MEKYRKIKIVGKGSFGHAILVQSNTDRKFFLMKIIDVSRMDRKQKEEALNEVHVLKAMRHPYIVTYRESFMDKRCLCIVMDYADGGDMYTKIAQQKKKAELFKEDDVLDWFVQISLALKHVHDRRILHRDLKTQNIFLTSTGDIKMGDFGIARVLQHTYDCAKTAIGTPYYLSPEICQEKPYNQKSDIWSLGCILYEMLTLKHAFDSNSMKGLVLKILRGNYPPIPDAFSDDMRHLMSEMLMKDPLKRPTIRKILEQKFLTDRITKIITQTVNKHQMNKQLRMNRGNPSIPKQPNPQLPVSSVHQPAGDERDSPERKSPMRVKGRGMDEHSQKEEHDSSSHRHVTHELSSRDRERESKHSQQNIQSLHDRAIKHQKDRDEHKIDFRTNPYPEKQSKNQIIISNNLEKMKDEQKMRKLGVNKMQTEIQSKVEEEKNGFDANDESDQLLSSINNCLHEDDSDWGEKPDQRVYARFLTPDGAVLPGIDETDSVGYRIETLRMYLEQQLDTTLFIKAYNYLLDPPEDENQDQFLYKLLTKKQRVYVPLIYQLIVCEDGYYSAKTGE